MRITESNITMSSARSYLESGTKARGNINKGAFDNVVSAISARDSAEIKTFGNQYGMMNSDLYNGRGLGYSFGTGGISGGFLTGNTFGVANQFQMNVFSMLLSRFSSAGMFQSSTTQSLVTYQEQEDTQFQASGHVKTDDGRTIDFNVDIAMSRSYMEYLNIQVTSIQNALCDPLVINIGGDTADVRDQTFRFDLDADGIEDEISMLGRGSGFLALDKNGDGKINDGSELFGTKSGDGFADLKEYDGDGNGWIDENDEIFSKLKVWCKGDNGEDILLSLKEADIGAIYLGSQDTEFTLNGNDGTRDGVIRSTGLFLRESSGGGVGTVQHVDMALKTAEDGEYTETGNTKSVTQTIYYSNITTQERRQSRTSQSSAQAKRREMLAKKRAAEQQAKKGIEQRRLDGKTREEEYEKKLLANKGRRKRENERMMRDTILEKLFEDREALSFI